jgi:hypothetical protein
MFQAPELTFFNLIAGRDAFRDPLALLPWSSIAYTVPAAFSMLLKLRYKLNSNLTLSAITFRLQSEGRASRPKH